MENREWLRQAKSIALIFDDRATLMEIRFRCDAPFIPGVAISESFVHEPRHTCPLFRMFSQLV